MSSLSKSQSTNSSSEDDAELRRGPWTLEEDTLLVHYIARHGEGRWNFLAKRAGLRRTGKSCRLRWLNYLKPDVKRGNLTLQEQLLILDLHSKWGNRWSKIAQQLPGRTDNEIKNYWRTRVQKQARHLKIDANSSTFKDIIRCFWMPRLVQKIEVSTANTSSMFFQNPTIIDSRDQANIMNSVRAAPPQPPTPEQVFRRNLDQTSDSKHGGSSCVSSADSKNNISQISQLSDYPISCVPTTSADDYNSHVKNSYYVDTSCFCTDTINNNLASMPSVSEGFGNSCCDCHLAEGDWGGYDFSDTMWNMDELFQFRNLHEKEV